jgi:hypothetical protein
MPLTNLGTTPTVIALILVHLGDEDADVLPMFNDWVQEKMGVGSFHITINTKRMGRIDRLGCRQT